MRRIIYAMQFRGTAAPGAAPNMLKVTAQAQSCVLTSVAGPQGIEGTMEPAPGAGVQFESDVTMLADGKFKEAGTITFGDGAHRLRFSTAGEGFFVPGPEKGWNQGAVIWRVDGGEGQFAGASGLITSNFVFNDGGTAIDHQFGVLYVAGEPPGVVS